MLATTGAAPRTVNVHANPIVTVFVTCSRTKVSSERRLAREESVSEVKRRLEPITGVPSAAMRLVLYPASGQASGKTPEAVGIIDDDSLPLGFYPVEDYMRIEVEVNSGQQQQGSNNVLNGTGVSSVATIIDYNDLSKVKKFELDEDQYDKRTDSVREYMRRNGLGRFATKDDQGSDVSSSQVSTMDTEGEVALDSNSVEIKVGARFETRKAGSDLCKRGTVRFLGYTKFKPGMWVGVEYDEPYGTHDGKIDGVQYFTCPNKHGAFLRPQLVEVGDFPELDEFDLDDLDLDDEI